MNNRIYELSEEIGGLLKLRGESISAAESCTGGLISHAFTAIPGSSEYYLGSVTSYANEVKIKALNVPAETIAGHGAVSSETVAAMAAGVRELTGSDYAIASSGIAGPGGGSDEKPVGLVWLGFASKEGVVTKSYCQNVARLENIQNFTIAALELVVDRLKSLK